MISSKRNIGLDATRTLAILGMMAAHTSRMIAFDVRPAWSTWILLLEPIIPSLFLFLVGVSLTLSYDKALEKSIAPRAWYLRQARRALILWIISTIFYVAELGPRFPDFVVVSGVLANIAYAILGIGALLVFTRTPRARLGVIVLALALGILVYVHLDLAGRSLFAINTGDAPFLPLWLFALTGALWNLARKRFPGWVFWTGIATIGIGAWWLHRFGLDPLFTKPFGRSDAGRDIAPPWFIPGEERHVGYYNLRPSLSLFCLCVHLGMLSLLGLLNRIRGRAATWLTALFILGRHSLEVYILHLTLLAILVVKFGLHPLASAKEGNWVWIGLVLICVMASMARERWGWGFKRPQTPIS